MHFGQARRQFEEKTRTQLEAEMNEAAEASRARLDAEFRARYDGEVAAYRAKQEAEQKEREVRTTPTPLRDD